MSSRMIFGAAMAMVSLVFATSCTHESKKKSPNETSRVLESLGRSSYTILEFPKGKSDLSGMNQEELKTFVQKVNTEKKSIEDIKILAWADREYPSVEARALPKDVILANERAAVIKAYLEKKLKDEKDISFYNMAKRPDSVDRMLETDDYALKTALEQTHPTTTRNTSGDLSYSKASKAIVIIDYQHH